MMQIPPSGVILVIGRYQVDAVASMHAIILIHIVAAPTQFLNMVN
jgi:hypothetical protein